MQRHDNSHLHIISSDELSTFWREGRLPTPLELVDNLILWIGDNQTTPLTWVYGTHSSIAATLGMAIPDDGMDIRNWNWLSGKLERKNLFELASSSHIDQVRISLVMAGWARYEVLKRQRFDSRFAFMALKFGQPVLDCVVKECIRPAVERAGFDLRILTDQQGAGLIDNQIRASLLSARFVISDLTHGSHGAYWEAGFGEGRGIPVIYTCEKTAWEHDKSHFDTNHMVTIVWDTDNLKKAEDALVATIRATLRAEAKQSDDESRD
jgi:hypothetical protein